MSRRGAIIRVENKGGDRTVITVANRIYVNQEYAEAFEQSFRKRRGSGVQPS